MFLKVCNLHEEVDIAKVERHVEECKKEKLVNPLGPGHHNHSSHSI
jgi:hypothetical protein